MKKRVLLVDDESSLRRSLTLSLNQEGYDVEPCDSGINALKKLETYEKNNLRFDTIVLDVKLPDIDGLMLGNIIKSKYPDSIIIFISGYEKNSTVQNFDNLSTTVFIEKPFAVKDLTYQFDELAKGKASATGIAKEEKTEQHKTVSAYAFLKLKKEADFFEVYRKLFFKKDLFYCDATKGEYDIVLLAQSETTDGCRKIYDEILNEVSEIEKCEFVEVEKPIFENELASVINTVENYFIDKNVISERNTNNKVSSYVLVEIEREKLDSIYPALRINENVVYCDYTSGKYNLVLLVKGSHFTEIDKLIENKIANLDGVLKVKEFPIINIFEM